MSAWWICAAIVCFAAVIQGVSGFAFGIFSMALLTLVWDPAPANVVVSLLAAYTSIATLYPIRRGVRWSGFGILYAGYLCGLPLGTRALVDPNLTGLLRCLVGVACLMIAYQNWFHPEPPEEAPQPPAWQGVIAGIASGFLSGSVSSGGAPILWYIYRRPWSRDELKATGLMMFFAANLTKLSYWGLNDLLHRNAEAFYQPERVLLVFKLFPAVILGSAIGMRLFRYFDRRLLRRVVCLLLVVMAGLLFLRTIFG